MTASIETESRNRSGRQDRGDAKLVGGAIDDGRCQMLLPAARAAWRSDDTDQPDVGMVMEDPERLAPEAPAPEEDGPHANRGGRSEDRGRSTEAIGPRIHARALVASRISASSSSPTPTAINSSIESR